MLPSCSAPAALETRWEICRVPDMWHALVAKGILPVLQLHGQLSWP
jgi:hypothetical protein